MVFVWQYMSPSSEPTPTNDAPLDIPLDVMVQQLSLNDIAVSYGDIAVQLDTFNASVLSQ